MGVSNMALYGGVAKLVLFGASFAVPAICDQWMIVAGLSIVSEIYNLYLINTAESASTYSSSTMLMGASGVALLVSAAGLMPASDDAEEVEEYYYEEPAPAEDAPADDGASDYGYGYYY